MNQFDTSKKILTLSAYLKKKTSLKNKKIVFTNGCFDILHIGHIHYLEQARSLGDALVIGLNSDASVRRLKGPTRPVTKQIDRARMIAALSCVDYVVIFSEPTPIKLITAISPDVLVKGGDWAVKQIVGHEHVLSRGGMVKSLKFVKGYSTTSIIEKIQKL